MILNFQSLLDRARSSRRLLLIIVFLSMVLDNMLLTVVVPIIPYFLYNLEHEGKTVINNTLKHSVLTYNSTNASKLPIMIKKNYDLIKENEEVGFLFSSKAFIQLVANPIIGPLTNRIGYTLPMFIGILILLASSLIFAFGNSYALLFVARSIQGVGSACSTIAGMSMIASKYPDDQERSNVMGFALGGIAVGVLVGYPFGGVMYNFVGKTAPFLIISFMGVLNIVLQLLVLQPALKKEDHIVGAPLHKLLRDPYILLAAGSVCTSTTAMAVLEPCLPIWLMDTVHPEEWQLGTVFVPDSIGYLIGTNLFGYVAFRVGRWISALGAMLLVALCACLIPFSSKISHLIIPHFGLGLGIGITDSALMPLLAYLVDTRYGAVYGSVYAIAQVAVCLAYSLGPLLGGVIVNSIGFPWLMFSVGIVNLFYSPLCLFLRNPPMKEENQGILMKDSSPVMYNTDWQQGNTVSPYRRMEETDDE